MTFCCCCCILYFVEISAFCLCSEDTESGENTLHTHTHTIYIFIFIIYIYMYAIYVDKRSCSSQNHRYYRYLFQFVSCLGTHIYLTNLSARARADRFRQIKKMIQSPHPTLAKSTVMFSGSKYKNFMLDVYRSKTWQRNAVLLYFMYTKNFVECREFCIGIWHIQ